MPMDFQSIRQLLPYHRDYFQAQFIASLVSQHISVFPTSQMFSRLLPV